LTLARCGGASPQETSGDSGVTDAASGTGATGGATGFAGSCCTAQPWVGCGDILIAQCVCAKDPYCCKGSWDVSCANLASSGCGSCETGGDGGASGAGASGGLFDGGVAGGFGGVGNGGSGSGTGALGGTGSGGSGMCDPNACPSANAPPCCISPNGPCGIQTNQVACVPDPCLQPGTACQGCLCGACWAETGKCTYYAGCNLIADCMLKSGCSGAACYAPATCQAVIDQHGGPGGSERQVADSVATCATLNGCSCK
jgi:hypothetical protein